MSFYRARKPIYTPVADGQCRRIQRTQQGGTIFLFPFPRQPCVSKTQFLQAALRKVRLLLSCLSLRMSALFFEQSCNILHLNKVCEIDALVKHSSSGHSTYFQLPVALCGSSYIYTILELVPGLDLQHNTPVHRWLLKYIVKNLGKQITDHFVASYFMSAMVIVYQQEKILSFGRTYV